MRDEILQDISESFSDTYFKARQKFLELAKSVKSYESPARGPGGEELFTDAAWFGNPDGCHVGVLISATHGVEGYCGSAGQVDWMRGGNASSLGPDQAMLLIHALNPYGFAWNRRVTEEGCDLNRNFVDFSQPLPINPGYDDLADHLVPALISGPEFEASELAIEKFRKENGEVAFQTARKAGQYSYPHGVFFGGFGPSHSRFTLERISDDFSLKSRDQVVIVDAHTGLGPFGYGELQTEQPSGLAGYERALAMFGRSVTSPDLGTSSSVAIRGCVDEFWQRLLDERHIYVALEFGTFDPENGRRVLREDHWLAKNPDADPDLARAIRLRLREHYDPRSEDWREMILWRSRQVHRQMAEGLRSSG
ncbi:M14 family metallopeptidase [Aminobacter anthyllidis]|uniref:M14 family metallopeptidase n=1 Tax=Aminobacter anthyllidis TaxID=1035067 RepID=A0A9X1AII8_9HYPH|nr:M14 family metallopeptidase [Aminobacter anthyllidis]MBT1160229.1 M14 family metallopeptidase [Aminobacter anthyllidis]